MSGHEALAPIGFFEKIKKVLAFFLRIVYTVPQWSVGQEAKTPPSHGGNRGSIPLRTILNADFCDIYTEIGFFKT